MGSACAPSKNREVQANSESQTAPEDSTTDARITETINKYQSDKERMVKELENYRVKTENDARVKFELTQQNFSTKEELAQLRAQLEAKDRTLLKHRLKVALHSKATSMATAESDSFTKQLITGNLEKFNRTRKAKSAKKKWVEVDLHSCRKTIKGFEIGYIVLRYAESRESQTSSRCQIASVNGTDVNVGGKFAGRCFSVEAIVGGVEREFVFACVDVKTKDEWVKSILDGLEQIEEEAKTMNEQDLMKIEFAKEKLGITVEERDIRDSMLGGVDTTVCSEAEIVNSEIENELPKNDKRDEVLEANPDEDEKVEEVTEVNAESKQHELEPIEDEDVSCELIVLDIMDEDILASGLKRNWVLIAINDITLRGLSYDEQIKIITDTKKPFVITFAGPKYLRKKTVCTTAYPQLLKDLVAVEDNAVKTAFYELVTGASFAKELDASEDKVSVIAELLSNHRKLTEMLQSGELDSGFMNM